VNLVVRHLQPQYYNTYGSRGPLVRLKSSNIFPCVVYQTALLRSQKLAVYDQCMKSPLRKDMLL